MRTPRPMTAVAVLLVTALGGTLSMVTTADARTGEGDRSVARAADRYDVSESALQARLREDPSLRLTPSGVAYFVDAGHSHSQEPARVIAQTFPLPDTFLLHSKPDAVRTIYLDFDGHTVSGTLWNGAPGGNLPNGAHPAWDPDGNGAAFTDSEKLKVQDIYQRVAEDYAPFDVDVTTQDPGLAALDRTNVGDQEYGTRALITPSSSAATSICNNMCGGVAFVGVFNHYSGKDGFAETHEQLQPAWIFPQNLGPNDPKSIAEGVTHEVGHTLGLDHDGLTNQGYYEGHNGWAPIMGVGYNQPIVQLALNDYHANAHLGGGSPSLQANADDFATIAAFGAGPRADEVGTSVGNAGAVPTGSAYIRNRTDVDYFALGTCSGTVTVQANNAPVSPNLDIELQLLNAGNAVLDTDDPPSAFSTFDVASGMDATVSASSLPSGQYYARVDGIGRGTPTNGYTDYGSVGAYTLQVTGCTPGAAQAKPGKTRIGKATPGKRGGKLTAKVTWRPPLAVANPAINGYRAIAYKKNSAGKYVKVFARNFPANTGGMKFTTNRRGSYKFAAQARNSLGFGPLSAKSNAVRPR